MGTGIITNHDGKIQCQREENHHHPMLCTYKQCGARKEAFYEQLQTVLDKVPKRDIKILMGDLNAKIGSDNTGKDLIMGVQALGEMNENGELFTDLCAFNELVIGGSVFPHKKIHKATWVSPDGKTENQIDHITISRKWRRSLMDTQVKRGADVQHKELLTGDTWKLIEKRKQLKHRHHGGPSRTTKTSVTP